MNLNEVRGFIISFAICGVTGVNVRNLYPARLYGEKCGTFQGSLIALPKDCSGWRRNKGLKIFRKPPCIKYIFYLSFKVFIYNIVEVIPGVLTD